MITFQYPLYFLLLVAVPFLVALYILRRKSPAAFTISTTRAFRDFRPTLRSRLTFLPDLLLLLCYILGVIALARPQTTNSHSTRETEGINIILALDVSGSMRAQDLKPNRIEAAREVARSFVASRPNDNIGLVVFAGESYTQAPLTTDHAVVQKFLGSMELGALDDGTAIGSGLATAVSRLKEVEGESKVVILLTDGTNNAGPIAPRTAAEIARSFGIRVYTIGVGTMGKAPTPVQTLFGEELMMLPVEIDESTLKDIAQTTGGTYFRATDNDQLKEIYEEIDQMEKVKLKVDNFTSKTELYDRFLIAGFLLALVALLLRNSWLKKLP